MSSGGIRIELLPPEAADDAALVADLCRRINEVYDASEEGLWIEEASRTSEEEVAAALRAGEVVVASLGGRIVGSMRIAQVSDEAYEFGLLVADPEHRGVGIGRELVRFAEKLVRSRGIPKMQLELLVPREGGHPTKAFLHSWYSRLGYREVGRRDFTAVRPGRSRLLVTPCDLVRYEKRL